MNKLEFSKLNKKEDMILAFNQLKDDYRQLFAINDDLQSKIDKAIEFIDGRIQTLTVSVDNKAKDEYFNNKCIGGIQELKNVKEFLKEDK